MGMTKTVGSCFLLSAFLLVCFLMIRTTPVRADDVAQLRTDVQRMDHRLDSMDSKVNANADHGAVLFLFGVFCALWAQNTNRNAWLWFFLGLFFSVVTVLFLLHKNSRDRRLRSLQSE